MTSCVGTNWRYSQCLVPIWEVVQKQAGWQQPQGGPNSTVGRWASLCMSQRISSTCFLGEYLTWTAAGPDMGLQCD